MEFLLPGVGVEPGQSELFRRLPPHSLERRLVGQVDYAFADPFRLGWQMQIHQHLASQVADVQPLRPTEDYHEFGVFLRDHYHGGLWQYYTVSAGIYSERLETLQPRRPDSSVEVRVVPPAACDLFLGHLNYSSPLQPTRFDSDINRLQETLTQADLPALVRQQAQRCAMLSQALHLVQQYWEASSPAFQPRYLMCYQQLDQFGQLAAGIDQMLRSCQPFLDRIRSVGQWR